MNPVDQVKAIQNILGVDADGKPGMQTKGAFASLCASVLAVGATDAAGIPHKGKASSFADPGDIAAYKAAKARGLSDQEAFRVGDNGIGAWGTFCGDVNGEPMCALPPEAWLAKWGSGTAANGKQVIVTFAGNSVTAELRDTMPHLDHIENGAVIDCNPALVKALGMKPPMMIDGVEWEWA